MKSPQGVAAPARAPGVLRRLFEIIDGPDPGRCVELLSPDVRFSVVFSNGPGTAQDFAGGRAAFDGYLEQRGAPTWTHHVLAESAHGAVEIVLGETRQEGVPVASFVAAVRLDADGRIDRYIVGRSTAVLFELA